MKKLLIVLGLLVYFPSLSQEPSSLPKKTELEVEKFFDSLSQNRDKNFEKGVIKHFDSISKKYKKDVVSYMWFTDEKNVINFKISYYENGKLKQMIINK